MRARTIAAAALLLASAAAEAQMPDSEAMMGAQRAAVAKLSVLDGIWRGPAWMLTPQGRREIVQTERVGSFLGGTLKVIEGRGYGPDGKAGFNAFGIVSWDARAQAYTMRAYAQGFAGDFPLKADGDGFAWDQPAGPGAVVRYTATVKGGLWHETGYRIAAGAPPVQIFDMSLRRIGDSDWPGAGAVPPR